MSEREDIEGIVRRLDFVFGDLTDQQVARQLGVSEGLPGRWRAGPHLPSALSLVRIIRAFGLRAEWLLLGHGPIQLSDTDTKEERRS